MKLYVASKWEEKVLVHRLITYLRDTGYTINLDWTTYLDDNPTVSYFKKCACDDVKAIQEADGLVVMALNTWNYKGTLVEVGVALGKDLPVFVIGSGINNSIFINHSNIRQFRNLPDCLTSLSDYRNKILGEVK